MAFPRVSQCKSWFGLAAFSSRGLSVFFALFCCSSVASPATEETLIGVANDVEGIRSIVADISTYVDNLEAQNTDIMAINSNVLRIRQALDIYLGSASNQSNVASIKSDVGTIKTDLGTIKSDVSTIKSDVGTIKTDVGSIKSDVGLMKSNVATMTSDIGTIKSTSSSIYSAVNAVQSEIADQGRYIRGDTIAIKNSVAVLSDIASDLSRIRDAVLNGGVSNGVNRAQLHAELQEVTSRLDNILTVSQRILGRDTVSSNDVAQIRQKLNSLESSFADFREDDFAPLRSSVSTSVSYLDSIRTDTGMLESYWMPELVDRLDSLVANAKTNSASAGGSITVTNQIDFSGLANLKIWEPFMAWTNFFRSWDTEVYGPLWPDSQEFSPPGFYLAPWMEDISQTRLSFWTDFMNWTLGTSVDLSAWASGTSDDWEGTFLYRSSDYGYEKSWWWWSAEAFRRQIARLDASTNYLARVSDGIDQLHTINFEILKRIEEYYSVSNVVTSEEYTSETNNLVSNVGFDSGDGYDSSSNSNAFPKMGFGFHMESVVEPQFDNDKLVESLQADLNVSGEGLFRVKGDLSSALSDWDISVPASVDVWEYDLNSESSHTLQEIARHLPAIMVQLYTFFQFAFYVLVVYGEIRYYLSAGRN